MSAIRREVWCLTPRSPRYLRMGWWMKSSGDPSSIRSTDASDRMANSCKTGWMTRQGTRVNAEKGCDHTAVSAIQHPSLVLLVDP